MDHVAIDLGGRESRICRRRSDGTIVEEKRVRTRALGGYLQKLEPGRVIVEACAEAFAVADWARAAGHQVRVVPATLAPSLGVGARRMKTDVRDAQALSEASCRMELPSVHIPSEDARQHKALIGLRDALVSSRTQLVNTVRGWMRGRTERVSTGDLDRFAGRVRKHEEAAGRPMPAFVERQLAAIEALTTQIKEADKEMATAASQDPVCVRLMTVPGIGPTNAMLFRALLDDHSRFGGAAAVAAYLGLTPSEQSSSQKVRRGGITKAGSARMRRLLVQGAWSARRCRSNDPMVCWSLEVEKRRGKQVAIVALSRKLAGILFAIWRDGTTYNAKRAAQASAATRANQERMEEAVALLSKTAR
jgi:transposase